MVARVYMDWNATAPPLEAALDAMRDVAKRAWANPSSVHGDGRAARAVVEDARDAVAVLTGASARDVVFTSGATEANNLALTSALAAREGTLVTSRLEHPSVTKLAERFASRTRWLAVLPSGRIDLADLDRALGEGPVAAVAIQSVNQETGVIQPLRDAIALTRAAGVWLHADLAQSLGKVEDDSLGATSRSVAPHKFRGPKGIGALVLAPGAKLSPLAVGGSQEKGLRPGTVDASLAAGFGVAAKHAVTGPARYTAVAALRDALEEPLVAMGALRNSSAPRAPHVSSLAFPGWVGPELVAALDLEGVSAASGSACSAGTADPSPVITAMHGEDRARASLRLSLGELSTREDIEAALRAFRLVLARL